MEQQVEQDQAEFDRQLAMAKRHNVRNMISGSREGYKNAMVKKPAPVPNPQKKPTNPKDDTSDQIKQTLDFEKMEAMKKEVDDMMGNLGNDLDEDPEPVVEKPVPMPIADPSKIKYLNNYKWDQTDTHIE